jgi:opacity protein-like surface antigen
VNWNGLQASVNGGLGISSLIYGKQNINGEYLDLSSQKEFSGIWVAPKLGLTASYNVDNDIYLSLGYAYSKSFSLSNSTDEKLSFNNSQIQFGVHFMFR